MIDIDATAFDQLEERIGQAIGRIRDLTRERDGAREHVARLEREMEQLRASHAEVTTELDAVRAASVGRDEFESSKREIERRVENLLHRFSELDEAGQD